MTKYYFIAYDGIKDQNVSRSGCGLYMVENSSLIQIIEAIKEKNNLKSAAITSMKDLTEEEYNMLEGDAPECWCKKGGDK